MKMQSTSTKGPSIKYSMLGGVGGCRTQRYEALHGGGGYLAHRYVKQFFYFICLVFSAFRLNALSSCDE